MNTIQLLSIICMFCGIAVYVFLYFSDVFEPAGPLRRLRKSRATSRLRKQLKGASSVVSTVVYWDRYRNLSKAELLAVAGEFGWSYAGQDIRPDGWALQLTKTG